MNVSLTPMLEEFIRRKVAGGLYNNASEVVREALRLLLEREAASGSRAGAVGKSTVLERLAEREAALRERGITSLALFGSVLRGEATPESDIDVLVDLDPDRHISLVDLVELKAYLESFLNHPVDVVTREGIDPDIRHQVFDEAERLF